MHVPDWQLHLMSVIFWLIHALPWLVPAVIVAAGAWWFLRKSRKPQ